MIQTCSPIQKLISVLKRKNPDPLPIIKVPKQTFTPYNAQATLHFPIGFWALYLPVTVHGRVSDIWRSYFAQALFPRTHASVGFLPRPLVVQDRNPHSYGADFYAEIPLYTKSSELVKYLVENYVKNKTSYDHNLIETIEELYIDMYERGFVEEADVFHIQEWIIALLRIGYQFPFIKSSNYVKNRLILRNTLENNPNLSIVRERVKIYKFGRPINVFEAEKSVCNPFDYNLTFGTADRHDGPRTDISSILLNMGQNMIQLGPELWKSHPSIFSKTGRSFQNNHPEIANMKGMVFAQNHISPPLAQYVDHSTQIHPDWPIQNLEFYRNDSMIMNIDAFICTFPASMCQLWAPFNKTLIFLAAHRYLMWDISKLILIA